VRLIVRPEAEADIAEGYAWYESQQIGLGERFLSEISLGLSEIEREPITFRLLRRCTWRAILALGRSARIATSEANRLEAVGWSQERSRRSAVQSPAYSLQPASCP
jgi:hypothetical protein